MNVYIFYIGLLALSLLSSSCEGPSRADHAGKLYVVTTTGMLGDMVQQLVGDSAVVVSLMQPGVDPHLYKASQGDLQKIMDADLVISNGLHLEGKMGEVFTKLERLKPVIAVGDSLSEDLLLRHNDYTVDPHIWFDVLLWKEATKVTLRSLQKVDPEHADYYQQQADRYVEELNQLDAWVKDTLATLPAPRRVLISSHDSFGYFGRAYGMEVRGLQGISTLSEIGLRDVTDLVAYIQKRNIPAVFAESSVSDKSLQAVLQGVHQGNKKVSIGGQLYSDAMGAVGSVEGTYLGMVKYNVRTMVNALNQ